MGRQFRHSTRDEGYNIQLKGNALWLILCGALIHRAYMKLGTTYLTKINLRTILNY